ncbi:Secreted frizzled-related protein 3 [Holothuria leucospilota]|uniref:Secreted frizzled-related protein 3 n=1 Tax=Holothuria leucospilota TaxID=206669 RepID=A0A9Q1CUI8_HOLLE|nr:Secreted frizzled-related protein 3 [Holothuria leucospilota]
MATYEYFLGRVWCCILGLSVFVFTTTDAGSMCEPIRLPMCSSLPYNKTRMPNLLDHSTQENARLAIEQFQELVDTGCSDVLLFFLCAMYAPICTYNFGPFGTETVPPCKSVCLRAKAGCEPIMNQYSIPWPEYLSCKDLPVYDKGVCISPEAIVDTMPDDVIEDDTRSLTEESSQSGEVMSSDQSSYTEGPPIWLPKELGNCLDCPYAYNVDRDVFFEKEYEYIIRARVVSFMQYTVREMYTTVIVEESIKFSGLIIPEGEVQLWSRGNCACPHLHAGREYIILCYEDLDDGRLLLEPDCTVATWNSKYIKRIRKWDRILRREQQLRRFSRKRRNLLRV